jgi:hypothetical protein
MVSILFPWNMDGHPNSSSRIELGFLPDSFFDVYSNGGNHTRVFVVSYAHGRILSVLSRLVIILRVRTVLLGHSMIMFKVIVKDMTMSHKVSGVLVTPQVSDSRFTHRHGFTDEVIAN